MGAFTNWVALLRERAVTTPARHVFSFLDDGIEESLRVDYLELDLRARAIASSIQSLGIAAGERAILLYPPGRDYVFGLLGCLYAGVVAVPVYAPRANASFDRIRLVAQRARAALVLSTHKVLQGLQQYDALGGMTAHALATDAIEVRTAEAWQPPALDAGSLAVLQFTSGSTGNPKGVELTHGQLLVNSRMIKRAFHLDTTSRVAAWIPPYHDMGLIGCILQPLYSGCSAYLMTPAAFLQRPMCWLQAISKYRATVTVAPNFAYELCVRRLRREQLADLDLTSLRLAGNGAEPLHAHTLNRFTAAFAPAGFDPRAHFPCYGMAEATLLIASAPFFTGVCTLRAARHELERGRIVAAESDEAALELVSSGVADPEVQVAIVDPVTHRRLPPGCIGELWIHGESVARGYWDAPEPTADTFECRLADDDEPRLWLRTGDLGGCIAGELFITGRLKDLIIIRGQNHFPHDIEATVSAAHPALRPHGVAAFSIESTAGTEGLGLIAELDRGHREISLATVERAVRDAVSTRHQLQVDRLVLVPPGTVPKTSSGKTQRYLARQRMLSGELRTLHAPEEIVA